MSELSLLDFLMTILNGIEYGSLSTTNRAYQWMKSNSSSNGSCLSYLKNYVSNDNLITQKELELFKKLEKENDLPSEEEIDKELENYFSDTEMNEFEFDNLQNYSDILKHGDTYLKEVNLADKFSRRKQNDLEVKIKTEERRKELNENEMNTIFNQCEEVNVSYNDILNNVQLELSKMSQIFDKLLEKNMNHEEHSIFQINFEIFKQINRTFLETVRIVMEKQFSNVKNDDQCTVAAAEHCMNDDSRKHIQTLIQVAHCFGERSFQNVQYHCEEAEFQQINEFITNLIRDVEGQQSSTVGSAQLQSQGVTNLETVDKIQKTLSILSENLEQYYKNFIVFEIFNDQRNLIENKLKSDKKRLRKVLDLCTKYVDLLTLQAFLIENEKNDVDLAIDMYHKTISTLENQLQMHSHFVCRIEKILHKMEMKKPVDKNVLVTFGLNLLKLDSDSNEKLCIEKVLNTFSLVNHDLLSKIRTLVDRKLNGIGMLKNNMTRLDEVIFNGPARQPFFRVSLLADKRIIESRCSEFNKIFRNLKNDYKDELKRLSSDDFSKIEKSLWIMFLTNSPALQENLQKLREKSGINKTLITKKTETSSLIVKKSNHSSYY